MPSIDCGLSPSPEIKKTGSNTKVLAVFLFGLFLSIIRNRSRSRKRIDNAVNEPNIQEKERSSQQVNVVFDEKTLNKNKSA
ncbi:MAG: hypothetical protein M1149_01265 [Candidatus Thermoplasmatota archaeon]|nr:hypothetical protein [Candidatus Thermoplasmatota archaeon]